MSVGVVVTFPLEELQRNSRLKNDLETMSLDDIDQKLQLVLYLAFPHRFSTHDRHGTSQNNSFFFIFFFFFFFNICS